MNNIMLLKKLFNDKNTGKLYWISLYKLCKETNKLDCFLLIYHRISMKVELDKCLMEYIRFTFNKTRDIELTPDGILVFFDILSEFFPENTIKEIWNYMQEFNKIKGTRDEFENIFDKYTVLQLKKFIKMNNVHESQNNYMNETRKLLLKKANAELEKRKKLYLLL